MRKCKQCWNIETNVVDKFNLVNNNEDSSTVDNAKNILVGTESNSSGNIVNVVLGTCVKI